MRNSNFEKMSKDRTFQKPEMNSNSKKKKVRKDNRNSVKQSLKEYKY